MHYASLGKTSNFKISVHLEYMLNIQITLFKWYKDDISCRETYLFTYLNLKCSILILPTTLRFSRTKWISEFNLCTLTKKSTVLSECIVLFGWFSWRGIATRNANPNLPYKYISVSTFYTSKRLFKGRCPYIKLITFGQRPPTLFRPNMH